MDQRGLASMPHLQSSQVIDGSPMQESSTASTESIPCSWTRTNTLILLDLYNKFRLKVATLEIRNFKRMWEIMSEEFKTCHGVVVTASNCENRWRVLERNYKKYLNNESQTGAGVKCFGFAEEMGNILGKRKSINPTVLLSATTRSQIPTENTQSQQFQAAARKSKLKVTPMRPKYNSDGTLEKIRKDKDQRHKEKFAFEKAKFEKLYQLELRRQAARETRNNFLKQNNELRREQNNILNLLLQKTNVVHFSK